MITGSRIIPKLSKNVAKEFNQAEAGLRGDLALFRKGKLPLQKLSEDVATMRQVYHKHKPHREDYQRVFNGYQEIFKPYLNMPLVERIVQIVAEIPASQVETIVGIETGGRGPAKLVKAVYDKIRANQGLQESAYRRKLTASSNVV